MLGWILFVFSLLINALLSGLLVRATQRLFEFDDLFNLLSDELKTNINYFEKLLKKPMYSDTPEVQTAQRNMINMKNRADEFLRRMREISNSTSSEMQRKQDK